MTRLFDAPYGVIAELIKNLSVAGLTTEDAKELNADKSRTKAWVASLHDTESEEAPPDLGGDTLIEDAFRGDLYKYTRNQLGYTGCTTLAELADWSEPEIRGIKRSGEKTIIQVKLVLKAYGLKLSTHRYDDSGRVRGISGTLAGRHAYRRDRLGDLPIRWFVELPSHTRKVVPPSSGALDLTISDVRDMTDSELEAFFLPRGIRMIRGWIERNVR